MVGIKGENGREVGHSRNENVDFDQLKRRAEDLAREQNRELAEVLEEIWDCYTEEQSRVKLVTAVLQQFSWDTRGRITSASTKGSPQLGACLPRQDCRRQTGARLCPIGLPAVEES
jgi:hypothetical protein